MIIYAGDGSNIRTRIKTNHCNPNVEGSALRQHVATELGYELSRQKRPSGSTRIRINSINPDIDEQNVSTYVRTGSWRYVVCDSAKEALDFQWFVIEKLEPLLNKKKKKWNANNLIRYEHLFSELMECPLTPFQALDNIPTEPGVYVLYHDIAPHA